MVRPVLLARAFILQASPRALLAILAVAISVAYGILAMGAAGLLGASPAAFEAAESERGTLLVAPDGGSIPTHGLPPGAVVLTEGTRDGARLVTLEPWPYDGVAFIGEYARGPRPALPEGANLSWSTDPRPYLAGDAYNLPRDAFDAHAPDNVTPVAAYVPGDEAVTVAGLRSGPWEGGAAFYEQGAAEIERDLMLLVIATGLVGGMLVGGFVRLEVLARQAELRTVASVAGHPTVRRIVRLRAVTLAATGSVLGVVGALTAARIVQTAMPGAGFTVPWEGILLAVGVTLATGTLLGFTAASATLRDEGASGRQRVRRFPGPVRFLVVSPRVFPGVFAATFVAVTVLSAFAGALAVPGALFGAEEDEAVLVEGTGNPLRGKADRFLGEHGATLEAVNATMPITFAPTVLPTGPVLVKGTAFEAWRHWTDASLVDGRWADAHGEATVGVRAARTHGLAPGDTVVLPASYRADHAVVRIVGVHATDDLADDELVTDLDTAGRLADYPRAFVTLVHVRMDDPTVDPRGLSVARGVQVVDVAFEPKNPAPLAPATVRIEVANFGPGPAARDLTVRINGAVSAATHVALEGQERRTLRLQVVMPAAEDYTLQVNPTRQEQAGAAQLVVDAPLRATPGERFPVAVTDTDGDPVRALILVDGAIQTGTDDAGVATVTIDDPGIHTVSALDRDRTGGTQVQVAPASWADEAQVVVRTLFLTGTTAVNETHYGAKLAARVDNPSGVDHDAPLDIMVDDDVTGTVRVQVASGNITTVTFQATVPLGEHTVGLGDATLVLVRNETVAADTGDSGGGSGGDAATDPSGGDDTTEEPTDFESAVDAIRRENSGGGGPAAADPSRAFLQDVFTRLDVAGSLVVLVTFLHTGALVWVSLHREVREREPVQASLRGVGMGLAARRQRAIRDTILATIPAVAAGVAAGVGAMMYAHSRSFPAAFGHALPVADDLSVALRAGLVVLVLAVAAALHAVRGFRDRTPPARPRTDIPTFLEGGAGR